MKGVFVTFEGGDGCGKSTQAGLLAKKLKQLGYSVVRTREPGGSLFSEHLRVLLLNPKHKVTPMAELFLYEASRAGHTAEIIEPALKAGKVVICERYSDATIAYQGSGRGIDMKDLKYVDRVATGGLKPDVTIYMKMPAGKSLGRIKRKKDRLEMENTAFHRRVSKGYAAIAAREKKRVHVVSASSGKSVIERKILSIVAEYLKKKKVR